MTLNDRTTWAAVRMVSRFNRRHGAARLSETDIDVVHVVARWEERGTRDHVVARIGRQP